MSPTRPSVDVEDMSQIIDARELSPWKEEEPCTEEDALDICSYNPHLNSIVSVYYEDITELRCDMLVMPVACRSNSKWTRPLLVRSP